MKHFNSSLWLVAGIAGSLVFWVFQVLTGPHTITGFMGQQVVRQGGYPQFLTLPLGWVVHLGVSLGYALFFALLMLIPFLLTDFAKMLLGLVIAAGLGWFTTLITAPAIAVTISLLAGKGQPEVLPGLNRTFGPPFWNHMLFFGVVWLIYQLIPYLSKKH